MSRTESKRFLLLSATAGVVALGGMVVAVMVHPSKGRELPAGIEERSSVGGAERPSAEPSRAAPGTGRLSLSLSLPSGSGLSAVAYAVQSSGNIVLARGTIAVKDPSATTYSQDVVLPPGRGDTVTFVGTSSAGGANRTIYLGRKTFDVGSKEATQIGFSPAAPGQGASADLAETGDQSLACQSCQLSSSQGICDPANITATSSTDPRTGEQTGIGWGCGTLSDAKAQAACLALVRCFNANDCGRPGENPVMGCYCGAAGPDACLGGVGITGACVAQYQAAAAVSPGAPAGATGAELSRFIATSASDPTTPVGLADNLGHCAAETHCDACKKL